MSNADLLSFSAGLEDGIGKDAGPITHSTVSLLPNYYRSIPTFFPNDAERLAQAVRLRRFGTSVGLARQVAPLPGNQLTGGDGAAEVVALGLIALHEPQEIEAVLVLHALGHRA